MSTQFSVGQMNQVADALEAAGYTPDDITQFRSKQEELVLFRSVLRGLGEVVITKYVVDLDVDPMVPNGWTVEKHTKGGQLEFDSEQIALYLDEQQQDGGVIVGNELRKKLKGKKAYNANLLEFYLANPNLISEEWKGKYVFFWGTIYRSSDGHLYVRYLYWNGVRWYRDYYWLGSDFDVDYPAVVPASN